MTNKNLLSLPSSFDEIVCPEFESRLEVFEWIVYQQKELLLLFQCHLNRGVRTKSFVAHFDKAKNCICNALSLSKLYEETEEATAKAEEIRYLADEMNQKCEEIREFPFI